MDFFITKKNGSMLNCRSFFCGYEAETGEFLWEKI